MLALGAVCAGEVLPGRRDHVDPGAKQTAQIVVVAFVRNLQTWTVDENLWARADDLVHAACGDHARRRASGYVAGIATGLGVAVHVQADQLQVGAIDDSA
ncbi:hypothetical protein GCM10020255_100920 [Rhodococcus baikonurensis]